MTKRRASLAAATMLALFTAAGCHKKAAPPPPPPAPPATAPAAAKPTISYFAAEPDSVNSGQPSQLRWSVNDATSVEIDNGIGTVSPNGRRAVYPTATTTYSLTATNSGGSSTAAVTITVTSAPPPAAPAAPTQSVAEILARQVQDLHFDYDKSDVRPEDQPILQADATALKTIFGMDAGFVVTIEGHCDERGSAEYNLGLGDRRASAVKDALVQLGLPADKLKTISYGKERPLCTDAAEECYARNRRAHFSTGQ